MSKSDEIFYGSKKVPYTIDDLDRVVPGYNWQKLPFATSTPIGLSGGESDVYFDGKKTSILKLYPEHVMIGDQTFYYSELFEIYKTFHIGANDITKKYLRENNKSFS